MHRSHFSFISAGLSQPRPTFQLPVYLNLCLMSPGECFSLSLLRLVSHIFLFSLHLKRAICKMYFENGLKQTELSFAPLSLLFLYLLLLSYNMFLYLYFFYAYKLCIHIVYNICICKLRLGKMYIMVMLEPGQTK